MAKKKEKPERFIFKYVIPDGLKDLYVNGVHGGITPYGKIMMHLYSERQPLPKSVSHPVIDHVIDMQDGQVEVGGNAVRLIQASVCMDIKTAISIRDWLTRRVEDAEERSNEMKEGETGEC